MATQGSQKTNDIFRIELALFVARFFFILLFYSTRTPVASETGIALFPCPWLKSGSESCVEALTFFIGLYRRRSPAKAIHHVVFSVSIGLGRPRGVVSFSTPYATLAWAHTHTHTHTKTKTECFHHLNTVVSSAVF